MFEDFGNRNAHSTNQRFVRWVYFALQDQKRSRVCIMLEKINSIYSKEEFIEYLQDLATDYTDNRDEWEKIDFKILAQLLYMGKIYD